MSAPLWVALDVEPVRDDIGAEWIWLGVAGPGFDFERAEALCAVRKVKQVWFERAGVRVEVDFDGAAGFADFVLACEDELMRDAPAFDTEAEAALVADAIRALGQGVAR